MAGGGRLQSFAESPPSKHRALQRPCLSAPSGEKASPSTFPYVSEHVGECDSSLGSRLQGRLGPSRVPGWNLATVAARGLQTSPWRGLMGGASIAFMLKRG